MVSYTIAGPTKPNKKTRSKTILKSADVADRNDQRPRAGVVGVVNGIDADLGIPLEDHVTPSFNFGQLHCPEQSISFSL